MGETLSQILSQCCTALPPELIDIIKLSNVDDALARVNGDTTLLSFAMQELVEQEGASITELRLPSVKLNKETARALFKAFTNLEQLTVQQETLTLQRASFEAEPITYKIEYVSDSSYPYQGSSTLPLTFTDVDLFFTRLIQELDSDRDLEGAQYSMVVTLPALVA